MLEFCPADHETECRYFVSIVHVTEEFVMTDHARDWLMPAAQANALSGFAIERVQTLPQTLDLLIQRQPGRAFAFTSVHAQRSKTMFCAWLGSHLALMGHRVLLIDADLYQPDLHHQFARKSHVGLAQILLGDGTLGALRDLFQTTTQDNLFFLPAGRIDLHPAALLNSPRLAVMMELCRRAYDVILINCTPLDQAGGTYPMSRLVDRTALLTDADHLAQRQTRQALRQIALSGGAPVALLLDEQRDHSQPLAAMGRAFGMGSQLKHLRRQAGQHARQIYDWLLQTPAPTRGGAEEPKSMG